MKIAIVDDLKEDRLQLGSLLKQYLDKKVRTRSLSRYISFESVHINIHKQFLSIPITLCYFLLIPL